jgi:hypothetical protein
MLTKKYLSHQVLAQAGAEPGCSYFWQGLMSVKNIFQQHCERIIKKMERRHFSGLTGGWMIHLLLLSFSSCFISLFRKRLMKARDPYDLEELYMERLFSNGKSWREWLMRFHCLMKLIELSGR